MWHSFATPQMLLLIVITWMALCSKDVLFSVTVIQNQITVVSHSWVLQTVCVGITGRIEWESLPV